MPKYKEQIKEEFVDTILATIKLWRPIFYDKHTKKEEKEWRQEIEEVVSKAISKTQQSTIERIEDILENKVEVFAKYNLCDDCQKVFTKHEVIPYMQDSLDKEIDKLKKEGG